jgi:hypothetical protein
VNREEALHAADSPDWKDRVDAGKILAKYEDDDAAAALGRLLLDPGNTAVIQETARELINRDDLYGVDLVFAIMALAPAEGNDVLLWLVNAAEREGRLNLEARQNDLASEGSAWARAGLRHYLQWRA